MFLGRDLPHDAIPAMVEFVKPSLCPEGFSRAVVVEAHVEAHILGLKGHVGVSAPFAKAE